MDVASITAREGALEPHRNILAPKFALYAAPAALARSHALVGLKQERIRDAFGLSLYF